MGISMHQSMAVALAALVLLSLSGCGKAGRPVQPQDSVYPRTYPDPSSTSPTTAQQKDGRALPPEWDQQDLNARFTKDGSYIDPSVQVTPSQIPLNSNLPNTTTHSTSSDPFSQGIVNSGQSPLIPQQTTAPDDDQSGTTPTGTEEEGTAQ